MENPINMDDLRVQLFLETTMSALIETVPPPTPKKMKID